MCRAVSGFWKGRRHRLYQMGGVLLQAPNEDTQDGQKTYCHFVRRKSSYLSYQTANGFANVSHASAEVCKSLKEMLQVSDIAYES